MAKVEKSVIVNTPVENIFSYINDPSNWLEFWPSLIEITDLQSLPNGGYSSSWIYKMAGMLFKGTGEHTGVIPNTSLVIKTKGGIGSKIVWAFRSQRNRTRVFSTIEYKVPIPLLGKLAEFIIVKMNEQEADLMMYNLQVRFLGYNH